MDAFDRTATWDLPTGDLVRKLRRVADLSQRELASVTGVSRSVIDRIEAGRVDARVGQLQAIFGVRCWGLVVTDGEGRLVTPLREYQGDLRDGADRRYPAHLDVIIDPKYGEWWADSFGLQSPPETFTRSRWLRDDRRAESQADLAPYRRGRRYYY
jgi:transcriptional regulator with XRE-family HTH domain